MATCNCNRPRRTERMSERIPERIPKCRTECITECQAENTRQSRRRESWPENMPVGMAYVPWQYFDKVYEIDKALQCGTIFPELNKPWYGKRGVMG